MNEEFTPAQCYEQLAPVLRDIAKLIRQAPCNQAGLAVMVAAHAFGVAGAAMGKDVILNAREIADIIVDVMRTQAPGPRLVKS